MSEAFSIRILGSQLLFGPNSIVDSSFNTGTLVHASAVLPFHKLVIY